MFSEDLRGSIYRDVEGKRESSRVRGRGDIVSCVRVV